MSDKTLYPTPTRVALLRSVDFGDIYQSTQVPYDSYEQHNSVRGAKVTSRVDEASRAGWIELEPAEAAGRWTRHWLLTDAGRAVLDGAK